MKFATPGAGSGRPYDNERALEQLGIGDDHQTAVVGPYHGRPCFDGLDRAFEVAKDNLLVCPERFCSEDPYASQEILKDILESKANRKFTLMSPITAPPTVSP